MKKLLLAFAALAFLSGAAGANEQPPIKIGEMMSYTGAGDFSRSFHEGWQLALDDFNAQGGVQGRKIEVISRDDEANPGVAVRVAEDLVMREHVVMLIGGALDHVGLALGSYAKQNKIPYIKQWAGVCSLFGKDKNPYFFGTMECTEIHGYVYAEEAARLPAKRWAIIAPNYQYGRMVADSFKNALKKLRPDVTFVEERYPPLNKIQAQEEIRALQRANPDAVFNQLFAADLPQYIRAADKLGFLKNRPHMADLIGSPETIERFGASYPDGWFTMGVPDNPEQPVAKAFIQKFEARYHKKPENMAYNGYKLMQFAVEALRKAKSTDPEAIAAALRGLEIDGPTGRVKMRAEEQLAFDNYWVGYTHNENGKGRFDVTRYVRVDDLVDHYHLQGMMH